MDAIDNDPPFNEDPVADFNPVDIIQQVMSFEDSKSKVYHLQWALQQVSQWHEASQQKHARKIAKMEAMLKHWSQVAQIETPIPPRRFNVMNATPPITATELAIKLGINKTLLSNRNKPIGKFFMEQCDLQKKKTPHLLFDKLFPIARECCRRSKNDAAGENIFNTVEEFKAEVFNVV